MNVLFVCTGNICRSPFAEGVARRLAAERGIAMEFASAGTYAQDEVTADAIAAAREHDVELSSFQPRQLTPDLVAEADVVVAMAPHHLADPVLAGAEHAAVFSTGEIRDPYGLGAAAYRQAYADIESAVSSLLDDFETKVRRA